MAIEVLLVKEGSRLAAADPISAETLDGMRQGEVVTATIRRPRNPRHHRLFFALMNVVFQSQERYATLEQLLDAVKVSVGHYDLVTLPGKVPVQIIKPRSISFASMDQKSFAEFYDRAVAFILTEVLPGVERADLERRVLEIVGTH